MRKVIPVGIREPDDEPLRGRIGAPEHLTSSHDTSTFDYGVP
jgi:hypothetical protein